MTSRSREAISLVTGSSRRLANPRGRSQKGEHHLAQHLRELSRSILGGDPRTRSPPPSSCWCLWDSPPFTVHVALPPRLFLSRINSCSARRGQTGEIIMMGIYGQWSMGVWCLGEPAQCKQSGTFCSSLRQENTQSPHH